MDVAGKRRGERSPRPAAASRVTLIGRPSLALAGRHGDAAHVEQVDEIGVGAEPAVGGDRIGEHRLERVVRRRGRHAEQVDRGDDRRELRLVGLQRIEPLEGVGGRELRARRR